MNKTEAQKRLTETKKELERLRDSSTDPEIAKLEEELQIKKHQVHEKRSPMIDALNIEIRQLRDILTTRNPLESDEQAKKYTREWGSGVDFSGGPVPYRRVFEHYLLIKTGGGSCTVSIGVVKYAEVTYYLVDLDKQTSYAGGSFSNFGKGYIWKHDGRLPNNDILMKILKFEIEKYEQSNKSA